MNKLNRFFEKSPLWQVYIFGWVFTSSFMAGLLFFLDGERFGAVKSLQIGGTAGLLFGLMLMLMVSMMRTAQRFYQDCNTLEDKVRHAKTREELGYLFSRDFTELRKRAFHDHMYSRLREIHTRMQTMVGYLPRQNPEA